MSKLKYANIRTNVYPRKILTNNFLVLAHYKINDSWCANTRIMIIVMLTDDYFKKFKLIVTATNLTAIPPCLLVVFLVVITELYHIKHTKTTKKLNIKLAIIRS